MRKKSENIQIIVLLLIGILTFYLYKQLYRQSPFGIEKSVKENTATTSAKQINQTETKTSDEQKSSSPSASPIIDPPVGFCLKVPVLMYHHIEPSELAKTENHTSLTVDAGIFDSQMQYLSSRGYHFITADDLVNALINHQSLEGNSVVITLDDGYSDVFTYAYQIARKYNVKLNLMIPTGLVNNPGYISWDQLREMVGSGLATAYDHSWSHYAMTSGNDEKDQLEIMTAKTQLEQQLGKTVDIFAYPYGTANSRIINLLIQDKFKGAFSIKGGSLQCDSYIFGLHRIRIGNAPLSSYGF